MWLYRNYTCIDSIDVDVHHHPLRGGVGGSNPHLVPFFRLLCSDVAAAVVAQRRSTGGAAAAAQRQRRSGSGSGGAAAVVQQRRQKYMATQLGRHPSRLCHAPKIMEDNGSPIHKYAQIYIQINRIGHIYSTRQNYGKKNVSIYRRRLSMIEKLRTLFFP